MTGSLLLLALLALPESRPASFHWMADSGWECPTRPASTTSVALRAARCAMTRVDRLDPQGRELWFIADVSIDSASMQRMEAYGLAIGMVASSMAYWNGAIVGRNGEPGSSRDTEVAGRFDALHVLPTDALRPGSNQLLLHLSAHRATLRLTAPVHFIAIAPYERLSSVLLAHYMPAMLMAGALVAALLYFAATWVGERRDTQSLLVVIMSAFALSQLSAELWRALWPLPYHWQSWRLIVIQSCATGFAITLVGYVATRFAPEFRRRVVGIVAIVAVLVVFLPGYDFRTIVIVGTAIGLSAVLSVIGVSRRRHGALALAMLLMIAVLWIAVDGGRFLDLGLYVVTALLSVALLRDQWRLGVEARAAADAARQRARELELTLLRRRFAPHWLLNTLNSVAEWIESDPRTAVRLIERLGEEFHRVAEFAERPLVSLAEEIDLCRTHLSVMSLRVDREFSLQCDGVDETRQLPPGVVQTLIENAFTHGRYASGGVFVLRQIGQGPTARLELDTPPPEEFGTSNVDRHRGEGLAFVRAQLRHAFGEHAVVMDGPTQSGAWRTQLVLGG
jgi:hypothetical protein